MVDKIGMALRSRTFWTIAVMFIIGGVGEIRDLLPASSLVYVEGGLALLATYFRVNPRAK